MTAIKTANIVEGNLAQEPKYFPEGQYAARIVFRIMHTDRRLNPQTNQWEDGRTTAVDVNFYGPAAERYAHHPQPARQPASRQPPASQFHQSAAIHQRGTGTGPVGGTTGTGLNHHTRHRCARCTGPCCAR